MREALKDVSEAVLQQPPGLVTVRIDPKTGLRLASGQAGGIFEVFHPEHVPEQYSEPASQRGELIYDSAEPLF